MLSSGFNEWVWLAKPRSFYAVENEASTIQEKPGYSFRVREQIATVRLPDNRHAPMRTSKAWHISASLKTKRAPKLARAPFQIEMCLGAARSDS
jgi:hypothetical protein